MPLPLLPLTIATLAAGAFYANGKKKTPAKGEVTPERQLVFETAINEVKDPEKLKKLADAYRKEGLEVHASLLDKRAKLRELPPDVKAARRDAFRKGMSSQDASKVKYLASMFESQGATGAASALREYAESLDKNPPKPEVKTEITPEKQETKP